MSDKLGTLKRNDPRERWPNEATHFTPWLAENLTALGEVLGIDLQLVEREARVGDFSADIVARDLGRDRLVIIENQLDATDHSHLGQLLTYAAGLDAGVVLWIGREFREEHRQTLDWLNRNTATTVQFFGVVVELLSIDDSRPAVNFKLVAFPNDWSRRSRDGRDSGAISGRQARYQEFFQRLIDDLRENHRFTNARIGQPQNWYSFTSGTTGFAYGVSFATGGRMRAELYIDTGEEERNSLVFNKLHSNKDQIEAAFGDHMEWEPLEGRRACRIATYRQGAIEDPAEVVEEHLRWAIDRLLRLKKVFGQRLAALTAASPPAQD